MNANYQLPGFTSKYRTKLDSVYTTLCANSATYMKLDGLNSDIHKLTFNTSLTETVTTGQLSWNIDTGTLELGLPYGSVLEVGLENLIDVINLDTVTLVDGTAVSIVSANGNRVGVQRTNATNPRSATAFIGLVTSPIASNEHGWVCLNGKVHNINTNNFLEGRPIYVDPLSAGNLTQTFPNTPNYLINVGIVLVQHQQVGVIQVVRDVALRLTDLSDVNGTPLVSSGQIPVWNQNTQYFDFDKNINNYTLLSTYASTSSVFTTVNTNSANWQSTFTTVNTNSANWANITESISALNGITIGPQNSATFYLEGSATVWNDLVMPIQGGRTGVVAPIFAQWGAGGLYVFKFDSNDEIHFSFQLPHDWKVGTQIYPHLHWCQDNGGTSIAAGLSTVRWNIEYTWAGIPGGLFTPSTTQTVWATADVIGANKQILTNIPMSGIDPITINQNASAISSLFMCRLYRGGVGDTYVDAGVTQNRVNALSFDIHYQIDSLGSEDILTKYIYK